MIGTEKLELIIELALWSGCLENERPLSLLIIAKPDLVTQPRFGQKATTGKAKPGKLRGNNHEFLGFLGELRHVSKRRSM